MIISKNQTSNILKEENAVKGFIIGFGSRLEYEPDAFARNIAAMILTGQEFN